MTLKGIEAFLKGGEPKADLDHLVAPRKVPCVSTEALEVRSFAPASIPWSDLAFESTEQVLRDWEG